MQVLHQGWALALSIPKPTVYLPYMHSGRLAPWWMAAQASMQSTKTSLRLSSINTCFPSAHRWPRCYWGWSWGPRHLYPCKPSSQQSSLVQQQGALHPAVLAWLSIWVRALRWDAASLLLLQLWHPVPRGASYWTLPAASLGIMIWESSASGWHLKPSWK